MAFDREKTLASAQKHLRKGNYDRAVREYEKILDQDPRDIRSKLKMADLLVKVDRFDDALSAYREVAFSYAREDLYEKAAAVYKQAMRIAPDDPVLHTDLGEAYYRLGRLKDAVRVFHKAQKIYKREENSAAQRDILERMVRIDPDDVGLRIQLAERCEKDGQRDQALELFRDAARQLREEGRVDETIQVVERMIFLEPNRLDMRKEVVRSYLSRGDEKHALKHLQYCFKLAPQDIETLELLGATFHRLGSTDKALLVYGELAALYQRLGENDRAAAAYRTILAIDPNHAMARAFLGQGRQDVRTPPPTRPTAAPAPPPVEETDALDGIEFLDEDEEDFIEFQEPDPTEQGAQTQGDAFLAFADDAIHGLEDQADLSRLDAYPEAPVGDEHTAAGEISESSLELIEIVEVEEPSRGVAAEGDDQIHQYLTESDVFLKYGLLDRAEDVITKVLQLAPDNLAGREQMRKLMERVGDKRGAAHQLVAMASLTADDPPRAQTYLQQAATLVDEDVLHLLAEGAGLDPALYANELAPDFISEVSEGLDEISSAMPTYDVDEDLGSYELDVDYEELEEEDSFDVEATGVDLAPSVEEFSIDDFVEEITDIRSDVEELDEEFDFAGADFVDVDVDAVNFDQSELAVLDDAPLDGPIEFDISAEDADAMFDELFGGAGFGSDSDPGEVVSEYETIPDIPTPGFSRTGGESLTSKFVAPVTEPSLDLPDEAMVNNSNLELGKTYKDMGLFSEAIDEFRSALEDDEAAPAALFHIALCYLELGEQQDARESLTALSQNEAYPAHWRARATEKLAEVSR